MKILVTGANGYIGKATLSELKKSGHSIIACDVQENCAVDGVTYLREDILEESPNLFERLGSPDLCIHLAWKCGFVHDSPVHMMDLYPHYRFLCQMFESGCKRICALGTMHEIGWHNGEVNNDTPCSPLSLYGISKNALRQSMLVTAQKKDWPFIWLRAFYIYSNGAAGHSIFAKIAQAENEGKTEFPLNSGKNMYDFCTLSALAKQIVAAALCKEATGIVNVCSGQPKALGEMVEEYIAANRFKIKPKFNVYPNRPYDSPAIWGNAERINEIMEKSLSNGE